MLYFDLQELEPNRPWDIH